MVSGFSVNSVDSEKGGVFYVSMDGDCSVMRRRGGACRVEVEVDDVVS